MLLLPAETIRPDTVHCMDCFRLMNALPDASVDMILTDMPYGTTACTWDTPVDLLTWWTAVKRILKPRGAFVTTASQPFTSALVMSNPMGFKYSMVWEKTLAANFMNAKNKPLALHEDILVFSDGTCANGSPNRMNYYPQGLEKTDILWKRPAKYPSEHRFVRESHKLERVIEYSGYPGSVLHFPNGNNLADPPTQKPLALFEYLIKTYTLPGNLIFDPFAGSGTTAVAARNLGRNFIAGDFTLEYVETARKRLAQPYTPPLFAEPVEREPMPVQEPLFDSVR